MVDVLPSQKLWSTCSLPAGMGTVFSVTLSGQERVLYSFGQEPDGENPQGGLVNLHGVLYGTTGNGGGQPYGGGTVFSILP